MGQPRPHLFHRGHVVLWAAVLALIAAGGVVALTRTSASGTPAIARAAASASFTHPGVSDTKQSLDFVRRKIDADAEPWKSAFAQMKASPLASLSRTPKPIADVQCGPSSKPDIGCTDERTDALAAYTDALMAYLTGNEAYAAKAVELMDAWAATITKHSLSNAPLQTGWAGVSWARAGELVRATSTAWPAAKQAQFATMLRKVYLPALLKGSHANGNWELIMTDAAVGISVFLDDRASYDKAVNTWRGRVPAYVYVSSDGALPKAAPGMPDDRDALVKYWHGQTKFVDGLAQETCRDFGHTGWGLVAASHVAETAKLQGGPDLFGEMRDRLVAALEFHAGYDLGAAVPSWLCGGKVKKGLGPVLETAYNRYHNQLGVPMPQTSALLARTRPAGTDNHFLAWETLTHGDNPAA
ncbi:alginate lyase family protein [Amycolatopsis sp. NPDC058986]|uniref:alginate lyase family protein n=1 Tax=unclassified Amycolatopsis TaxID=2618356 RepID=UPI0036701EAB